MPPATAATTMAERTRPQPKEAEPCTGANATSHRCSRIHVRGDFIVLPQKIRFKVGRRILLPESRELLKQLAGFLRHRTDLTHISIESHSAHESTARARRLSDGRAREVLRALASFSTGRQRLTSKGFGANVPLVPAGRLGSAEANQRIEFRIVDRAAPADVPLP